MSLSLDDIAADAEEVLAPANEKLTALASLGQQYELLLAEIADLKSIVENREKDLHKLRSETIPDAMSEIGMKEFTLSSGMQIRVEQIYRASIPAEKNDPQRRAECFQWLEDNGHGDLIKHEVKVPFGRDETDAVQELKEALCSMDLDFSDSVKVESSTLKAFAKEQGEAGNELPDIMNPWSGEVATIEDPTKKRRKKG